MMASHVSSPLPSVAQFYAEKNVFLTGATGFVGKVLIEKLLRCCPNIKGIYCLIRPKRGQEGSDRLCAMLDEKCYDRLRADQPHFADKVHAIHGDILEEGFGVSESDKQRLDEIIHIVIHSAATLRFTEHLRIAMQMNVLAVRKMIAFCRPFQHLQVLVHVSTAYANCDLQYIEEKVYAPYVHPKQVIDAIDWMDDEMIDAMTPKLLRDLPNTYTFTKKLAEALLLEEAADLPVAIVRPSIVTASWSEPLTGWVDNYNGMSGLCVAYGKGLLQSFKCDKTTVADIIPVDFPCNAIITAAWHTALVHKPVQTQRQPLVYHITSGNKNPFTWGELEDIVAAHFKKYPLDQAWRRPGKKAITSSSTLHNYWLLVSHLIPAYAADLVYRILGKKPRMVQIYSKLHKAMNTLQFFTEHTWEWSHYNLDSLKLSLSPEDQKIYYLNVGEINWENYMQDYCIGTKTHLLKEDLASLPAARAHIRKLRNIRYVFNTLVVILLWRLLVARSGLARNSWYLAMGLVYKFVQFFKISSTIKK